MYVRMYMGNTTSFTKQVPATFYVLLIIDMEFVSEVT